MNHRKTIRALALFLLVAMLPTFAMASKVMGDPGGEIAAQVMEALRNGKSADSVPGVSVQPGITVTDNVTERGWRYTSSEQAAYDRAVAWLAQSNPQVSVNYNLSWGTPTNISYAAGNVFIIGGNVYEIEAGASGFFPSGKSMTELQQILKKLVDDGEAKPLYP